MNTPETINIEKYANALNNLVGMDIGYLGDTDKNVNAIVEVLVAAKRLENRVKELTQELKEAEEEYDRVYERAEADIRGNMADGGTSCHWCIDGHRREVVQQMQSMIKEECLAGGIYPAFVARVVENVGKKLLEDESNG